MERKYSLAEIDRMRNAIGVMIGGGGPDHKSEVESRLRTYMQNGTTIAELMEAAGKAQEARYAHGSYMSGPFPAVGNGIRSGLQVQETSETGRKGNMVQK